MPASVGYTDARKVQPNRKAFEPAHSILMSDRIFLELAEKFRVLARILRRMTAKEVAILISSSPANGVKLMIA